MTEKEFGNKNRRVMECWDEYGTIMECGMGIVMQWSVEVSIVLKECGK